MATNISNTDRDELKKAILSADDYQDNTEYIRSVKCSDFIRADVETMEHLRISSNMQSMNMDVFKERAKTECRFLYERYPDIFKRLVDDTLDKRVMINILDVLKKIEIGELEQQEGSLMVGRILKTLYVDPAIQVKDTTTSNISIKAISWKDYKKNKITTIT